MEQASLELAPIHRPGGAADGGTWQERSTFDYVIDGRSLARLLGVEKFDLVGRFDVSNRNRNRERFAVLVGEAPADFRDDRVILFECPECGDLGCGAITATLAADNERVIWSDFRHENNYDDTLTTRYPDVGPFTFSASGYRRSFERAL